MSEMNGPGRTYRLSSPHPPEDGLSPGTALSLMGAVWDLDLKIWDRGYSDSAHMYQLFSLSLFLPLLTLMCGVKEVTNAILWLRLYRHPYLPRGGLWNTLSSQL